MNGVMLQGFEWQLPSDGAHWKRIAKLSPMMKKLGVSAVWLPPAYKGNNGKNDTGYGVYDMYDLGEFNQKGSVCTKYGTAREYIAAIRALKGQGIQVLADIVFNQRIGADETEHVSAHEVDPNDRNRVISEEKEIEAYTRFVFPGRKGVYSDFVWDCTCFTGVDWDAGEGKQGLYQFSGRQWAQDVNREYSNFDYLMGANVDVSSPKVAEQLQRWGMWYYWRCGMDGFRMDAVKHISAAFLASWLNRMRVMAGKPLYAVGEYWSCNVNELHGYLDTTGESMNLFDVPLHDMFHRISCGNGQMDMAHLFENTLVGTRPHTAVTFVDNHDTQPGQSLQSWVQPWFKPSAYGLILLRSFGYPCVFWGDLYGLKARGIRPTKHLPLLMRIRQSHAWGEEHDYFDHPDLIGFTRQGDKAHASSGLAFLCTDAKGGRKRMYVGKHFAGKSFVSIIGMHPQVKIDRDGFGDFRVANGALSVYVPLTAQSMMMHQRARFIKA